MTGLPSLVSHPRARLALQILPWALLLLIVLGLLAPNLTRSRMATHEDMQFYAGKAADTGYATPPPGAAYRVASEDSRAPAQGQGPGQAAFDRKIVRTGSIDLVVKDASAAVQRLQALAQSLGGYVESSNLTQSGDAMNGTVKLRIPAARFDEARAGARALGLRVQSESVEATDVTRQFVDLEASLRNYRAEEAQYLEIMKRAARTEDVLAVAEHLAEVRGRIERTQADLNLLSRQVDMSTLTVNLVAQAEAQVWGIQWRPLFNARRAFRDLLAGLADYLDSMVALVIWLPLILLWAATVLFLAVLAWKLLRWVWKRFLKRAPAPPPAA